MRKEKISLILSFLLLLSGLAVGVALMKYPQVLQKFAAVFMRTKEVPKVQFPGWSIAS